MHIVYIHQHFCTNEGTGGTRSYDVSRHLVRMGHQVTVLAGTGDLRGAERLAWYCLFKKVRMDGFDVVYCKVAYANRMRAAARMLSFFWFAFLATVRGVFVRRVDVVFATSTPLMVGIPGYLLARAKRTPFVFEVRDIWPETFVQGGWASERDLGIRLMGVLERFLYRVADKILVVSPGFFPRLVARGVPAEKLKTVLLGADGSLFGEVTPDADFRRQYGLEEKQIAIYTGAHGQANGLDYILEAAKHSLERTDIAYVLIGAGGEKDRLRDAARERGLTNVVFAEPVPKHQLPGIMAHAMAGMMILKDIGEPWPVTPNKIFDYMFMGLPAVVNFTGPTWEMVEEDECGLLVDPKHPVELATTVERLADDRELAQRLGENGRRAALQKYERTAIARELATVFEEVAAARGQAPVQFAQASNSPITELPK